MKKIVFALSVAVASVLCVSARTVAEEPSNDSNHVELIHAICNKAAESRYQFDYKGAENLTMQAIMVFNTQSAECQTENQSMKSELYYDLARYRSLQNDRMGALDALEEAVDFGWNNHEFARNDGDLDNIRREKRFRQVMHTIKSESQAARS